MRPFRHILPVSAAALLLALIAALLFGLHAVRDALGLAGLAIAAWLAAVACLAAVAAAVQRRTLARADALAAGLLADGPDCASSGAASLPGTAAAARASRRQAQAALHACREEIALLRGESQREAVTRLPNRRALLDRLQHELGPEGSPGQLMVLRLRGLAELNRRVPRHQADQWLRSAAQRMLALLAQEAPEALLARLNGSDFAVLAPGADGAAMQALAENLHRELPSIGAAMDSDAPATRWAVAQANYQPGLAAGTLLAGLDNALMQAESQESRDVLVATAHARPGPAGVGEYAWRDRLSTALDQHGVSLAVLPVADGQGRPVHGIATLVLHPPDAAAPLPAEDFMPAAARVGLAAQCDIQAVRLALDRLAGEPAARLAVPLAPASLDQPDFLPRLQRLLQDRAEAARRLVLEVQAPGLAGRPAGPFALAAMLPDLGVRLGIRGLGREPGALAHLHRLRAGHVRLDDAFVDSLAGSPGSRHLAEAIAATARELHAEVHARDVAEPATRELLARLGIRLLESAPAGDGPSGKPETAFAHGAGAAPASSPPPSRSVAAAAQPAAAPLQAPAPAGTAAAPGELPWREMLQAQRQAMALLAHELRSPLATLSTAAQSLEFTLAGSGEDIDARLARMRRAVGRLDELAERFMQQERLAESMLQPRREQVDLAALAGALAAALQPDVAHQLRVHAGAAQACCDRALSAEVLRNLLHNAVKYSPADQPVDIALGHGPDGMVWLSVTDYGPGIAEADIERVFQPSYRSAAHRETRGSGQGLYLARSLCERQGGSLQAGNRPGAGACLTMRLPAAAPHAQAAKT